MKTSPKGMAIIYFLMAALFIYMAVNNVTDTIWNTLTIVFTIVAALDLTVALRFWRIHLRIKQQNKKK